VPGITPPKESLGSPTSVWGCPPASSKQLSMTRILTAGLAMESGKKTDEGKGEHCKVGAPVPQARFLAGLPDCNMAGSTGGLFRSLYNSGTVRAESKVLLLKTNLSSRSRRTSQSKSPKQDGMVFKVPMDKKRNVIILIHTWGVRSYSPTQLVSNN